MAIHPYIVSQIRTPTARSFYRSQFHEHIWMQKAHGKMLVKQGLLPFEDYKKIKEALEQVEQTLTEEQIDGNLIDLYYNIMKNVYALVGEDIGCRIHIGRSRNDMNCTCNRMALRREILVLMEKVQQVMVLLLKQAQKNRDVTITYYTYGQPAQPGTYGHYLLMLFAMLSRDFQRLQAAYATTNVSPMGAATGIGTQYPLDPAYTAQLLGFDCVIAHATDAISSTDYILEAASAVTNLMTTVSRFAHDLIFWSSYECPLLNCENSIATSSSIMPQKKNPVCFELLRSRSARASGILHEGVAMTRSTSLFVSNDAVVEFFGKMSGYMEEADRTMDLLEIILLNTTVNRDYAKSAVKHNFSSASCAAEYLAIQAHVPFTRTHDIVGNMVKKLMETENLDIQHVRGPLLAAASEEVLGTPLPLSDEHVIAMMDPVLSLERLMSGGTPKSSDMEELITAGWDTLKQQERACTELRDRLSAAQALTDAEN